MHARMDACKDGCKDGCMHGHLSVCNVAMSSHVMFSEMLCCCLFGFEKAA